MTPCELLDSLGGEVLRPVHRTSSNSQQPKATLFPAYIILGLPFSKNLGLMADREGVQATERDRFVSVLTKIGKLVPKLMTGKRPDSRYPLDRPSIKKRIEVIQAFSSQLN